MTFGAGTSRSNVLRAPASLIDGLRSKLTAVGHPHANGRLPFREHFRHLGPDHHLAAVPLNERADQIEDPRGTSYGVTAPVQIVARHDGVNSKAALRRGQSVVAPLACEQGDQIIVRGKRAQDLERGASCPPKKGRSHEAAHQPRHGPRHRLFGEVEAAALSRGVDSRNVGGDAGSLGRKVADELFLKPIGTGRELIDPPANVEPIVHVRHRAPAQGTVREVIERRSHG